MSSATPFADSGRATQSLRLIAIFSLLFLLTGCKAMGWVAAGIAGGDEKVKPIASEYQGLAKKKVAVLVSADERVLYMHPGAPLSVSATVSSALKQSVTGIETADPAAVIDFQKKNPYWVTVPYGELTKELKVDRVVIISLSRYSLNEPGNREIWQGNLAGQVSVAEADGKDPDNFAYTTRVAAQFPEGKPMGVVNANEETIELGMLKLFAERTAALLGDKKVEEK